MRIFFFALMIVVGFVGPWWMLVPLALVYAFWYRAYELLALGFFLDASYGVYPIPFIYTLSALVTLFVLETLKPRLRAI